MANCAIYIQHCTKEDWLLFLNFCNQHYVLKYGAELANMSNQIDINYELAFMQDTKGELESHFFALYFDNIHLHCYPCISSPFIELDIEPQEVANEEDWEIVLSFLATMSSLLKKSVQLTWEGLAAADLPIITIDAEKDSYTMTPANVFMQQYEAYHSTILPIINNSSDVRQYVFTPLPLPNKDWKSKS